MLWGRRMLWISPLKLHLFYHPRPRQARGLKRIYLENLLTTVMWSSIWSFRILSYNLNDIEWILTEQKLLLFILSSPCKIGQTSAKLYGAREMLIAMQVFINSQISFPVILRYTMAFWGVIYFMVCITKSSVTGSNSNSSPILPNSHQIVCTVVCPLCWHIASPSGITWPKIEVRCYKQEKRIKNSATWDVPEGPDTAELNVNK